MAMMLQELAGRAGWLSWLRLWRRHTILRPRTLQLFFSRVGSLSIDACRMKAVAVRGQVACLGRPQVCEEL